LLDSSSAAWVSRHQGFTLIELLVVISIVAFSPASCCRLGQGQSEGQRAACLNNLKQLQACWQMYVDDHNDFVPPNRSLITNPPGGARPIPGSA